MYSDLVKNKTFPPLDIPQTIVPIPSTDNYDTGVITRYFIQKANDPNGFVFEVDFNVKVIKLLPILIIFATDATPIEILSPSTVTVD